MPDLDIPGYDSGLWIAGRQAVGLIASGADGARVRLEGGGSALLPPGHPDTDRALALPQEALVPTVPHQVTAAQARALLDAAGMLPAVEAAVAASPNTAVRYAWEYSPYISRDSALVATLAAGLGLTAGAVDSLFIQAGALDF